MNKTTVSTCANVVTAACLVIIVYKMAKAELEGQKS